MPMNAYQAAKRARRQLAKVNEYLGGVGEQRTRKSGVPYLFVQGPAGGATVVWFGTTQTFKVFWPYPYHDDQHIHEDHNAYRISCKVREVTENTDASTEPGTDRDNRDAADADLAAG